MPDAIDEILRWVSPITHFARVASQDWEVHGMTIRAGDQLALYFASANRDKDVFDGPVHVSHRSPPESPPRVRRRRALLCRRAPARAELDVMLRLLLERVGQFELAGPAEALSVPRSTEASSIFA